MRSITDQWSFNPDQDVLEGEANLDVQEGQMTAALNPTRMSWKGRPTWMSRKAELGAAFSTQPGCPGRGGQPGCPGRPYDRRPLNPTRISWKGRLTWMSREAEWRRSQLNQDVLEGEADLDFQEGRTAHCTLNVLITL